MNLNQEFWMKAMVIDMTTGKKSLREVTQQLAELERKAEAARREIRIAKLEKKIDVIASAIVNNETVLKSIIDMPNDELQEIMEDVFSTESFEMAQQNAMPEIMILREKKEKRKKKKAQQKDVTVSESGQVPQQNFVSENRVRPVQNEFGSQGNA